MDDLLSIQKHARRLFHCLSVCDNHLNYQSVYNWLDVASRIEKVKYNGYRYDYSLGYCKDDYSEGIHKLNNKLLPELVLFNFIWSSLESLITVLKIPECPYGQGKILSATYFIKSEFEPTKQKINYYEELMYQLKILLKKHYIINTLKKPFEELFKIKDCTSKCSIGLAVVYAIRNEFAHGSFLFPEPEDFSLRKPYEIDIFSTSSRIVLLSIQMLLIAKYKNQNLCCQVECFEDIYDHYLPLTDYLRILHYYQSYILENDEQQEFEF